MYGKIFDQIYDGTLADNWQALITFQQMIVLCDSDGTIDMTPKAISRRTGIPIEHIEAGIDFLEKPDEQSRSPEEDGKRIVRLDQDREWGWYIVNHEKYKSLQDSETIRAQNRERKRLQRERENKSRCVTDNHGKSRYTNTDTNIKNNMSDKLLSDALEVYEFYIKHVPLVDKSGLKQPCLNNVSKWLREFSIYELIGSVKNYAKSRSGQKAQFNKKPSNFFGRSGDSSGYFKGFLDNVFNNESICVEPTPPADLDPKTRYADGM